MLDDLANDVELALEPRAIEARRAADENLFEVRFDRGRRGADQPIVGRHVAPRDDGLPLFLNDPLDERFDGGARIGIAREKDRADAVLAFRRQFEAKRTRFLPQELVRHLNKDAGAVAGVHFAAARAAMQEVD